MRRGVTLLAAAGAAVAAASCRAPTEVTFVFSTDEPCERVTGTTVAIGALAALAEARPVTAQSAACAGSGDLGTLVVVPSGARDAEVALEVVLGLGRDPASCAGSGFGRGCVAARRAVRFIPHTPLRVPVTLRAACDGVICPSAETCTNGMCTSATIADPSACAADGCPGDPEPRDAAPTADGPTLEAAADGPADAGRDAPPLDASDGSDAAAQDAGACLPLGTRCLGDPAPCCPPYGCDLDGRCACTDGTKPCTVGSDCCSGVCNGEFCV